MRQLLLLALCAPLLAGCSSKKPPVPNDDAKTTRTATADKPAAETTADQRAKLFKDLKGTNQKARRDAADELSAWVDTDPEAVAGLLEALKDKTTAGPGKTNPLQVTSAREAAARALLWAGPKGEAALKDKGIAVLREGLSDPQPAVREHTAYTIGLLGPIGRPLSADVMKLCTGPDSNASGRAFDALKSIGVTDVTGFVTLLNDPNPEVARLAAEQVPTLPDVPAEAVPQLVTALGSSDATVRRSAAAGIVAAGPKGASAAPALADAIRASYPAELNPMQPDWQVPDQVYWRALGRIGEPAVPIAAALLEHTNVLVQAFAARTLGEIGPAAKPAVAKLKAGLDKGTFVDFPIEAAVALCAIGEGTDEAVTLMKRLIEQPNVAAQAAIRAIPRMGTAGKPLMPIALGKLKSEVPFARFAAVDLIGSLPPAEAATHVTDLGKLTADPVPDIRLRVGQVLEGLGKAAAPAAEDLGKAMKEEKVEPIRDQFLSALLAMGAGAKPALPALLSLVREKSLGTQQHLRLIAAVAVADPSSKEVLSALLAAAGDRESFVRTAAATALGKLDPLRSEAIAKLVSMAQKDETNPRLSAVRALAMAGAQSKPARAELEAIANGPQPGLALWAKVGLAGIDGNPAKAGPVVRAGLMDKVPATRSAAAEALLFIGPLSEDLPALMKLTKDVNSTTRAAVARGLGALGEKSKEAVPQLLLLLNDVDGDVRTAAAEAAGNLGSAGQPMIEKLNDMAEHDPLAKVAAKKSLEKLGAVRK